MPNYKTTQLVKDEPSWQPRNRSRQIAVIPKKAPAQKPAKANSNPASTPTEPELVDQLIQTILRRRRITSLIQMRLNQDIEEVITARREAQ